MKSTLLVPCILAMLFLITGSVSAIGGDVGYLSINSVPVGADVMFDGSYLGETLLVHEVYSSATPSHTLSISKYGYDTWTETYNRNPEPGETIYITARLVSHVETGTIQVTSSP